MRRRALRERLCQNARVPTRRRHDGRRRARGPVLAAGLLAVACSSPPPEPVDPASRLAAYDAPVIDYLESLGPDDVGRELAGVPADPSSEPASDEVLLEGVRYLGRASGVPGSVHLHVVERDGELLAYLWVDTDGEPFPLPDCSPGRVGFRARRVWGPIYTWKAAQPGDGVLVSACPRPEWIESLPDRSAPAR